MATTLDRLAGRLASSPVPFVTFYDLATGERVELSGVTTANWVAKTSNYLVDEHEVEPGTRIRLGLPTHWLRIVWLLSAWTVGATVTDRDAAIGVSGPELEAGEPVRLAASLRPLGARFAEPPIGFVDLALEVPAHGDLFVALDPPGPHTVALDLDGTVRTHAELAGTAGDDRRLVLAPSTVERDALAVAAALAGGGSLVLVSGGDDEAVSRVTAQEGGTRPDA